LKIEEPAPNYFGELKIENLTDKLLIG